MFAWETAKARQASLLEIFPEVFCTVAPAAQRLATAFGEAAPNQIKEDRPPGEPSPAERSEPAEPKANFVANPKANQDLQRTDPNETVEPMANFVANPTTSNAAGMPPMPERSQSVPRATGRKTLTLSAQADEEKNKREKDALGRRPFVPQDNPAVRVPRQNDAIREDLRREEHKRQRRSQSVQNRGTWAVPSPKYEKTDFAIDAFLAEGLANEQEGDIEINLGWGEDIRAKRIEAKRLKQIQLEEEEKEAERKRQEEESQRKLQEEKEKKKKQQEEEKKEAERKKQEEESRRKLQEEKEQKKKQQEEEAARQRQQAADGKPNADDKGQPPVHDENSSEAAAENEGWATSFDTVPSVDDSETYVSPMSSTSANPVTAPRTYEGFMTVCRMHEHYLLEAEKDVVQIPQDPGSIVIPANRFLPGTEAVTFAVWQSPEVSGGMALATAESIIREYPTGKPKGLNQRPKQFQEWVDGVTELYTRQVTLVPNNVGQGLEVDLVTGDAVSGILPKYISKSAFLDEWPVCQVFKLKYGDMEVPDDFVFPSSRAASEETLDRPTK